MGPQQLHRELRDAVRVSRSHSMGPGLTERDILRGWSERGFLPEDAEARRRVLGIWPELGALAPGARKGPAERPAEAQRRRI